MNSEEKNQTEREIDHRFDSLAMLLDEERILRSELPGYNEYASRVRQRLIPYIW
jgi:hypothetical protein